jgi:quinol-cytochrome oxidoreductase complex cytochrome b subunit
MDYVVIFLLKMHVLGVSGSFRLYFLVLLGFHLFKNVFYGLRDQPKYIKYAFGCEV